MPGEAPTWIWNERRRRECSSAKSQVAYFNLFVSSLFCDEATNRCLFVSLAIVDNLMIKTFAWEGERNTPFQYDGVRQIKHAIVLSPLVRIDNLFPVPVVCNIKVRLVAVLEEYKLTRLQKEEERRRHRVLTPLALSSFNECEITIYGFCCRTKGSCRTCG